MALMLSSLTLNMYALLELHLKDINQSVDYINIWNRKWQEKWRWFQRTLCFKMMDFSWGTEIWFRPSLVLLAAVQSVLVKATTDFINLIHMMGIQRSRQNFNVTKCTRQESALFCIQEILLKLSFDWNGYRGWSLYSDIGRR